MEVWRNRKLILVAVLIAVMLSGSVLGMSCSATGGGSKQPPGASPNAGPPAGPGLSSDLLAKVAETLGIDQQKLEDAFAQAQSEMQASMPGGTQLPSAPPNAGPPGGTPPEGAPLAGMPPGPGLPTDLLARVAEILGIDQQTLEDAFAKVQSEMPGGAAPPNPNQQ